MESPTCPIPEQLDRHGARITRAMPGRARELGRRVAPAPRSRRRHCHIRRRTRIVNVRALRTAVADIVSLTRPDRVARSSPSAAASSSVQPDPERDTSTERSAPDALPPANTSRHRQPIPRRASRRTDEGRRRIEHHRPIIGHRHRHPRSARVDRERPRRARAIRSLGLRLPGTSGIRAVRQALCCGEFHAPGGRRPVAVSVRNGVPDVSDPEKARRSRCPRHRRDLSAVPANSGVESLPRPVAGEVNVTSGAARRSVNVRVC